MVKIESLLFYLWGNGRRFHAGIYFERFASFVTRETRAAVAIELQASSIEQQIHEKLQGIYSAHALRCGLPSFSSVIGLPPY